MRLLLDTHTFLWLATDPDKLPPPVANQITNADNELFLSLASVWEMTIKISIGKLVLRYPLHVLIATEMGEDNIRLLPIELEHVLETMKLPFHHRDPFDRLLIAQSIVEKMPLVSADSALDAYSVDRIW